VKNVLTIYDPPRGHWVGDGFPVRSLFSYDRMGAQNISPFLLLDYAGPAEFQPALKPRGVGQHPHRGFETVTVVFKGELEHRDTSGAGGLIAEGDVQWMTAGAGIVHEEFHSQRFTEVGGVLHMVQLWVNLPASAKDTPAAYQTLLNEQIPEVPLKRSSGTLRVIAGDFLGHKGPAKTFTPINLWDLKLAAGERVTVPLPKGHTKMVTVLEGTVMVDNANVLREAGLANLNREGQEIVLEANNDARALILTGEPINEPVAGYGPFVMNTQDEIQQAIADFQAGKFGVL